MVNPFFFTTLLGKNKTKCIHTAQWRGHYSEPSKCLGYFALAQTAKYCVIQNGRGGFARGDNLPAGEVKTGEFLYLNKSFSAAV